MFKLKWLSNECKKSETLENLKTFVAADVVNLEQPSSSETSANGDFFYFTNDGNHSKSDFLDKYFGFQLFYHVRDLRDKPILRNLFMK